MSHTMCRMATASYKAALKWAHYTRKLILLLSFVALAQGGLSAVSAEEKKNDFGLANSKEPIDIEADNLKVNDNKKSAEFSGNVKAVQGKFILRSTKLKVIYSGDPTKAGANSSKKKTKSQVSKLTASGKVHITTPDNQNVTSETAVFDVKNQLVTFDGDVVVNQGGNIVKSSHLVINLKTKESVFNQKGSTGRIRMKLDPSSQKPKTN